jgi:hypothetical protein
MLHRELYAAAIGRALAGLLAWALYESLVQVRGESRWWRFAGRSSIVSKECSLEKQ